MNSTPCDLCMVDHNACGKRGLTLQSPNTCGIISKAIRAQDVGGNDGQMNRACRGLMNAVWSV